MVASALFHTQSCSKAFTAASNSSLPRSRAMSATIILCKQQQQQQQGALINKRSLLAGAALTAVLGARPSYASSFGDALSEFLRSRQRLNGGEILLAPIRGAQTKLRETQRALAEASTEEDVKVIMGQLRAASYNCFVFEPFEDDTIETKASLVQQGLGWGDPCTWRLIARNVTNRVDDAALKAETLAAVEPVILSLQHADDLLDRLRLGGDASLRREADTAIEVALARTQDFEDVIKRCMGL